MGGAVVRRALIATLMLAVFGLPAAQAAFPGQNGKLAFTSDTRADLDTQLETMNPDGSQREIRVDPDKPRYAAWSPDGRTVAYVDDGDPDQFNHIGYEVFVHTATVTRLTFSHFYKQRPAWSPDGQRIAYGAGGQIRVMNADGTGDTVLWSAPPNEFADDPAWSPDGTRIAFNHRTSHVGCDEDGGSCLYFPDPAEIKIVNVDGSGLVNVTNTPIGDERWPTWSPDGSQIAFRDNGIEAIDADGTGRHTIASGRAEVPAWSPDGQKIAFVRPLDTGPYTQQTDLFVIDADGTNEVRLTSTTDIGEGAPDWQRLKTPYARPRGATPIRLSLVPAYRACTSPNRTHGPPLAHPSCNPPLQESSTLTVGDAPAQMSGFVRYTTIDGDPATPADEADLALQVHVTDVRMQGTLGDYAGEIEAQVMTRMTDRGGTGDSATTIDVRFPITTPCVPTASTTVGSACSLTTTLDTLIPGAVVERARTMLQLGQVRVVDGGPDGDTATEPNTVFLRQGIFVP